MIAAGPAHAGIVAAIHRAAAPDSAWSAEAWRTLLAAPGARARIAMDGCKPVGFLHLRRAGGEAEITMLATHPDARRQGVATALLAEALAAAGAGPVFLEVAVCNRAARALYARFGFEAVGRRPGYYRAPSGRRDALVLRLATDAGPPGRRNRAERIGAATDSAGGCRYPCG